MAEDWYGPPEEETTIPLPEPEPEEVPVPVSVPVPVPPSFARRAADAMMGLLVGVVGTLVFGMSLFWLGPAAIVLPLLTLMALASSSLSASFKEGMIVGTILTILLAILAPNFQRRGCGGHLTACKSNVKNLATACEMYSTDNSGYYPPDLSQLTPNYLKTLPQCPGAGGESYSTGFVSAHQPVDAYTICCTGMWHTSAGIIQLNYPQYSSYFGLILP